MKNIKIPSGSSEKYFSYSENQGFSDCLFLTKQSRRKK
jgi:hypothetical protein